MRKNANFTYFNMLILYMWLQVIKVKVTHQGKGHIKVKVKISTSQFYVKFYLFQHVYPLYVATGHY